MWNPDAFPRTPLKKRLLIVLLAVATAAFVTWAMTRKSGLVRNAHLVPADVAVCSGGQTAGCVGSTTAVIASPLPASAAAAR